MDDQDDRRREERITINKEFESFDAFVHEYVTNISRTGVFVRSKEPLPIRKRSSFRKIRERRSEKSVSLILMSDETLSRPLLFLRAGLLGRARDRQLDSLFHPLLLSQVETVEVDLVLVGRTLVVELVHPLLDLATPIILRDEVKVIRETSKRDDDLVGAGVELVEDRDALAFLAGLGRLR